MSTIPAHICFIFFLRLTLIPLVHSYLGPHTKSFHLKTMFFFQKRKRDSIFHKTNILWNWVIVLIVYSFQDKCTLYSWNQDESCNFGAQAQKCTITKSPDSSAHTALLDVVVDVIFCLGCVPWPETRTKCSKVIGAVQKCKQRNKEVIWSWRGSRARCINQSSPEKQKIHRNWERNSRRFIVRIGSHNYGGWEISHSATCELVKFSPSLKVRDPGESMV